MTKTYSPEILVAASDSTMRGYLDNLLRTFGYAVTTAKTFQDARECVMERWPDILISDIRLGDFNGLHLGWIRHFTDPGRPTILTHVLFDRSLDAEARHLGAPYVVVPTGSHRLIRLVEDILSPRRWPALSPTPAAVLNAKRLGHPDAKTNSAIFRKELVWKTSILQS